ncbi:S66 peptidase family protein [Luteolibacter sp. LG18]|uniref:S66 family peptidase n=1 Tax=Luteolibacter sp. LG18 TaxID=2819286 RepID=UPI002B28845F|nr:LD-carboxypeptidase [Luteolibacter sp. LG18]
MDSTIHFPKPLRTGHAIGITAPSSGVVVESHLQRLELIEGQLRAAGYGVIEGKCLRADHQHVSGTPQQRAADFTALWNDPQVGAIIPPWGGELLIGMLPHLDFTSLAATPKWVMGYSDISTLLLAITATTGIATAHGPGLMDLVRDQVASVWETAFEMLGSEAGARFSQRSFERYQVDYIPYEAQMDAKFNLTEPVEWKRLGDQTPCRFSGRLIGGCLDTVVHLAGTPYGHVPAFLERHRQDGVIVFLENCGLAPVEVVRSLWQLRLAGWFEGVRGLVLGRSAGPDVSGVGELGYREAVESVVGDLSVPVLIDADIGHRPPQMVLVNGALARVEWSEGAASVVQRFI